MTEQSDVRGDNLKPPPTQTSGGSKIRKLYFTLMKKVLRKTTADDDPGVTRVQLEVGEYIRCDAVKDDVPETDVVLLSGTSSTF